jgi:hypothetical protein
LRPPSRRAADVHKGIPATQMAATIANCIQTAGKRDIPQASGIPHKVPHVPGAKGISPIQNPVANHTASPSRKGLARGGIDSASGSGMPPC